MPHTEVTMHNLKTVAIWLALSLMLAGCAQPASPLVQSVQAREIYISTLTILVEARKAGRISDEAARQIELSRAAAAQAIDALERSAADPQHAGWAAAVKAYNDSIDQLLAWRLRTQRKE